MILELIKKRRSVRKFTSQSVDKKTINYILEAGRISASGGNEQAWKFGLIDDKDLIKVISEISYNQSWISTAPFLIVLCTEIVSDERGARQIQIKRFPKYESEIDNMSKDLYSYLNLEEHQTKIPGTQMVLAALEKGIYSTWVSYFDVIKLQELLKLKPSCIPSEIIAFGYPEEIPNEKAKKSLDDICFRNKFAE